MDISLHSFILVVGLVVMAFILWDGVKKVRESRANRLTLKLGDLPELPEEGSYGAEFPNGGARVIGGESHSDLDEFEFSDELMDEHLIDEVNKALRAEKASEIKNESASNRSSEIVSERSSEKKSGNIDLGNLPSSSESRAKSAPVNQGASPTLNATQPKSVDHESTQTVAKNQAGTLANQPKPIDKAGAPNSDSPKPKHSNVASKNGVIENKSNQNVSQVTTSSEKVVTQKPSQQELAERQLGKSAKAPQSVLSDANVAKESSLPQSKKVEESDDTTDDLSVPMLMESIRLGERVESNPPEQKELELKTAPKKKMFFKSKSKKEPEIETEHFSALDDFDPLMDDVKMGDAKSAQSTTPTQRVGERLADRPPAQEVLVINVLKDEDEPLQGADLKHIFQVCDLRHGEMGIFHRFEKANAQGKIQFSVANGVEPGTFDPATIETSVTPGISFFMSLPGPENPMEAFDAMVEVAHVFARNFNAEIHDESHSDLTPQTIEHCRQRIREFNRKHLSTSKV